MAKRWSITSLLALGLLGCLLGTEVEAQASQSQNPAPWTYQSGLTPQSSVVVQPLTVKIPHHHLQHHHQSPPHHPPHHHHQKVWHPHHKYPHQQVHPIPFGSSPNNQYDESAVTLRPPPNIAVVPMVPFAPTREPIEVMDRSLQEPQVPKPQQHAMPWKTPTYNSGVPKQPPAQSCEVERNVRVPCGGLGITPTECQAINCCFDGQQCYFGTAVTVQCTKDAHFIVVVAKDVTLPNIDLETITLMGQGQGCTHVDTNSAFAIFHFPVTACGSVVTEEPGVIIYENRMSSTFEVGVGRLGEITRDSHYELLFQCRYISTSVETVVVEVLLFLNPPLPVAAMGFISVQMRLANGQCYTQGCKELDAAYSSFYTEADYPVRKVLRDPVYVEVQLLDRKDPMLVLTLGRCWATKGPKPHSFPQWDILIDGCPYRDDRYLSSLVPVPPRLDLSTHYRRFLFKMFAFVDPNSMDPLREQVYIHCSTAVCVASPGARCEPACSRRKRDVEAADQTKDEPKIVVTSGPLIFATAEQ
ncbi:zona pellucida sperm-binding protein 4-like [Embiotoca jacksoni]|uniref:zona pellucida sperm-binding protein 4-like n=1 Tax=Embiotoca jacksoni TaxID=100190 RepID=UPI003704CD17